MRILLVEDEEDLAHAITDHLRDAAHAVDHAATLDEALAAVQAMQYALILLDLRLPDGNGLSLLKKLRNNNDKTPVLIGTAFDQITERIAGLEAGADDYLVKPYNLNEMLARITAILRRSDNDYSPVRRFGRLCINPSTRVVMLDVQEISLTRKEWAILDRVSRRPDITVTKAELEDVLYGFGQEVESNAIEAHVSRLRSKLGSSTFETVRGFGYKMGQV